MLCAILGGTVLVIRLNDDPGLEVETAKPSLPELDPASRGIEAPGTTSTTTGPSTTTTTFSVPHFASAYRHDHNGWAASTTDHVIDTNDLDGAGHHRHSPRA